MTSGQWTIIVSTKCSLCFPRSRTSPSLTTSHLEDMSSFMNWDIIFTALAEVIILTSGNMDRTVPMLAEWSGSIWCTTK